MKSVFDILDSLPDHINVADIWVANLSSENHDIRKQAILSLSALYPKLVLVPFLSHPGPVIPIPLTPYFKDDVREIYPMITAHLAKIHEDEVKVDLFFDSLLHFPACSEPVSLLIHSFGFPALADKFDALKEEINENRYRNQVMVALTYSCDLRCNYCFSETAKHDFPEEISLENFEKVLSWCRKNAVDIISLTGGEPTMHTKFDQILDRLDRGNFECYFATNNLFNKSVLESILNSKINLITIHINDEDFYTDSGLQKFRTNLKSLSKNNVPLCFRYNISDQDQAKWPFIFDLAKRYNIRQINVALPFPDSKKQNFHIQSPEIPGFKKTLLDFLLICNHNGIKGYLSKPIPVCMFSLEEIRQLIMMETLVSVCTVYRNRYTYNLVVNPDLSVIPCMSLDVPANSKIVDFPDFDAITEVYRSPINEFAVRPFYNECQTCELFYEFLCQGGCLSYKV